MSLRDRLRSLQGSAARPPADVAGPEAGRFSAPDAPVVAGSHRIHPTAAPLGADVAGGAGGADVAAPAPATPPGLATLALWEEATPAHGPETLLPGAAAATPYGECFVVEWRYPLAHRHGIAALGPAAAASLEHAAPLLARRTAERAAIARAAPSGVVYLDTETTGLAGGTGTYAFLVGVARLAGDAFVVRQIFMRELAEEPALLHLLAEELAGCEVLVTYNGKTFDWPLLETRYTLARRGGPPRPRDPAAHADLLFAARRLWRERLASCALGEVERALLGVRRGEDTPGWLIPQLYFGYLRSRDARPLAGVFRHNALDLLSLAGLLGHVAALCASAPRATEDGVRTPAGAPPAADELLALGRCHEEEGDAARALACYEAALAATGAAGRAGRAAAYEARLRAAAVLKRLRRPDEAVAHWEALIAAGATSGGTADVRPYEELAKYYEHVARDPIAARECARRALALVEAAPGHRAARERARLRHRLARLESRR
jgi:uncharacterized protein YprB with RNaseH-like and TPR domain